MFSITFENAALLLNCLQEGKKIVKHSCGFSIKPSEIWLVNSRRSIQLFLIEYAANGPSFTCSCSATTFFKAWNLFSYNCIFWLSAAEWWPPMYKAQTMNWNRGCTLSWWADEWMQRWRKKKRTRGSRWAGTSWKDWPSLRFVSRSSALKAEERNGGEERERGKRETAKLRGVKFLQTIPAFPTRLIKLWLC